METSKQILSQEKRIEKSDTVDIQFTFLTEDFAYFNVVKDGKIKYIGRIEKTRSLSEYCSCPDQFHRNSKAFQDSHGFALRCKHMIQALKKRGWY